MLDQRAFQENASTVRRAHMEAEVAVRFILNDILTHVAAQGTAANKAGRWSSNKGAQRRTARSLKFKQNCIRDYDDLINQCPIEHVAVLLHVYHTNKRNGHYYKTGLHDTIVNTYTTKLSGRNALEMRKYKRIATVLLSRNLGSYGAFRRVYI